LVEIEQVTVEQVLPLYERRRDWALLQWQRAASRLRHAEMSRSTASVVVMTAGAASAWQLWDEAARWQDYWRLCEERVRALHWIDAHTWRPVGWPGALFAAVDMDWLNELTR
jgi:hypothetical protein